MREATASRQTGQFAYFAAQAPQRMWPQGTSAVDFSGSKHIGHSSRSGVPGAAAAGAAVCAATAAARSASDRRRSPVADSGASVLSRVSASGSLAGASGGDAVSVGVFSGASYSPLAVSGSRRRM